MYDEYHPIWYVIVKAGNLIACLAFIIFGVISQSMDSLDLDYQLLGEDLPVLWCTLVIALGVFAYALNMMIIRHFENVAAIRDYLENKQQ